VTPILGAVGGEQIVGMFTSTAFLHPVTGPALVIVGSMMMMGLRDIAWNEPVEAIPAFLTLIAIPLTFSIANGIMLGFISYPILMAVSGRWKEVHWLAYILAFLFVVRFVFLMFCSYIQMLSVKRKLRDFANSFSRGLDESPFSCYIYR